MLDPLLGHGLVARDAVALLNLVKGKSEILFYFADYARLHSKILKEFAEILNKENLSKSQRRQTEVLAYKVITADLENEPDKVKACRTLVEMS